MRILLISSFINVDLHLSQYYVGATAAHLNRASVNADRSVVTTNRIVIYLISILVTRFNDKNSYSKCNF